MKGDREFLKPEENLHEKFASYIQALTGSTRERVPLVWMEHSYARAFRGASGATKGGLSGGGARTLLLRRAPKCPDCYGEDHTNYDVDIDTIDKEPEPPIPREPTPPLEKALNENETEQMSDKDDDWEEKLQNLAPTTAHYKLLSSALECIKSLRMLRLCGAPRGADHFARKLRRALAAVWCGSASAQLSSSSHISHLQKPATWLHAVLATYLPKPYLDCYVDIIAILKVKIPSLMEQMLAGHHLSIPPVQRGPAEQPVPQNLDDDSPLLVFIPSGREIKDARWVERFRAVLPVVRVHCSYTVGVDSVAGMAASAVSAGRSKVLSLLSQKPNRRLILVGHGVGSIFAAQVAVEAGEGGAGPGVVGVALLAPPLLTWAGPRGLPDDLLLDLHCPTLMVIGQNAMQCDVEEAEAVRSRLRMWSRLVIVGAADDQLRLDFFKCTLEKVTQEMVECALADEVAMFVKSACQWAECPTPPTPPPAPPTGDHHTHVHNGEENQSRPANRRRAGGVSGSPPHPKRLKQTVTNIDRPPTPVKGRNVGLFKVNNPPADTTTLSMGHFLTIKGDDDTSIVSSSLPVLTQPGKLKADGFLQITNSRTVRKLGDGTPSLNTIPGKPLIKVLENVSIVGAGGRIPTSLSGIKLGTRLSLGSTTPIMDSSSLISATPINSTNIMDIPIIFADDNKSLVHLQPSSVIGSTIPIISTSVTQPLMISTINTTPNHTISIKRSTLTPPVKYSKVIIAKRPSTTPEASSAIIPPITMTQTVSPTSGTGKVLGRPIIVRGKSGHLTAFRVMPNNTAALVIKRANVISASNMKTLAGLAKTKVGASPTAHVRDSGDEISNAETEMATREIEKQIEAMTENVSL